MEESPWKKVTENVDKNKIPCAKWKKTTILVCLSLQWFLSLCSFSMIAPFFPQEQPKFHTTKHDVTSNVMSKNFHYTCTEQYILAVPKPRQALVHPHFISSLEDLDASGSSAHNHVDTLFAPPQNLEADSKGVSMTTSSLVFTTFALVSVICSPLIGALITIDGPKTVALLGLLIEGSTQILFGFTYKIQRKDLFLAATFGIRALSAVGGCASTTSALAMVANTFQSNMSPAVEPAATQRMEKLEDESGYNADRENDLNENDDDLKTLDDSETIDIYSDLEEADFYIGVLETFAGFGLMAGPPIGGLLYRAGGFELPFLVVGSITLLTFFPFYFILPAMKIEKDPKDGNMKLIQAMKIPVVFFMGIITICTGMVLSFLDPIFQRHLNNTFHLGTVKVGLVFLIWGAAYAISAPALGTLAEKTDTRYAICSGAIIYGLSFPLLGPPPFISAIPSALWLNCVALAIAGLGLALYMVPALSDMYKSATRYGMSADLSTQSALASIFNSALHTGMAIGASLSGLLVQHFSFAWATTITAKELEAEKMIALMEEMSSQGRELVATVKKYGGKSKATSNCNSGNVKNIEYGIRKGRKEETKYTSKSTPQEKETTKKRRIRRK
eukprot:gene16947-8442_t